MGSKLLPKFGNRSLPMPQLLWRNAAYVGGDRHDFRMDLHDAVDALFGPCLLPGRHGSSYAVITEVEDD